MRMTKDHYKELADLINMQIKRIGEAALQAGYQSLADDPRVKVQRKRFIWDVFYCIPQQPRQDLMSRLYEYLTDSHIETALDKLVPKF